MVNISQIRNICDTLDGNCHACPFGTSWGCPFLSEDPMNWNINYINERFQNSPLSKVELGTTLNTGSPKLPTLEEVESYVNSQFAGGSSSVRVQGASMAYDFICRQLRASA
jgi:hypothetical protein